MTGSTQFAFQAGWAGRLSSVSGEVGWYYCGGDCVGFDCIDDVGFIGMVQALV
jgi:hypothetical protein